MIPPDASPAQRLLTSKTGCALQSPRQERKMQRVMSDPFFSGMSEDDLYPSSDGQPMAETELHADEMTEVKLMLRRHFRADRERVYVGSNLFVYYERGEDPGGRDHPRRDPAHHGRGLGPASRSCHHPRSTSCSR
jgi:hypothetical protein